MMVTTLALTPATSLKGLSEWRAAAAANHKQNGQKTDECDWTLFEGPATTAQNGQQKLAIQRNPPRRHRKGNSSGQQEGNSFCMAAMGDQIGRLTYFIHFAFNWLRPRKGHCCATRADHLLALSEQPSTASATIAWAWSACKSAEPIYCWSRSFLLCWFGRNKELLFPSINIRYFSAMEGIACFAPFPNAIPKGPVHFPLFDQLKKVCAKKAWNLF